MLHPSAPTTPHRTQKVLLRRAGALQLFDLAFLGGNISRFGFTQMMKFTRTQSCLFIVNEALKSTLYLS